MCQSISHCYLSPSFSTLSASCSPKPICYYWRYKYLKAGQKEEEVNNALCGAICSCRIRGLTQNKLQSLFMLMEQKKKKTMSPSAAMAHCCVLIAFGQQQLREISNIRVWLY